MLCLLLLLKADVVCVFCINLQLYSGIKPTPEYRQYIIRHTVPTLSGIHLQGGKYGGILFTFSCSQVVDKMNFRNAVFTAAAQSGRSVRILKKGIYPRHPIFINLKSNTMKNTVQRYRFYVIKQ